MDEVFLPFSDEVSLDTVEDLDFSMFDFYDPLTDPLFLAAESYALNEANFRNLRSGNYEI